MIDWEISGKLSRGRAPIQASIFVRASGIFSNYSQFAFNRYMSKLESELSIVCYASGLPDSISSHHDNIKKWKIMPYLKHTFDSDLCLLTTLQN